MDFYPQIRFDDLDTYAELFILIGRVELTLRERVPITLSSNSHFKTQTNWTSPLLFNIKSREAILKAFHRNHSNYQGLEHSLPLSFWVLLFSKSNFENLWLPHLYSTFLNLRNPHSSKSYQYVVRLMRELLGIRNQIAHFNLPKNSDMENTVKRNQETLLKIIEVLG